MKIPVSRRPSKLVKFQPFAPPLPLTPMQCGVLGQEPADVRDELLAGVVASFRGNAGVCCFEKLANRLQLGLGHSPELGNLTTALAHLKGDKP